MWRLLVAMHQRAKRPMPKKVPMWAGLVTALLDEAKGGVYEERIATLLRSAPRHGKLRNHIIHTGWHSVGPDGLWGRRHQANGDGSMMMFLTHETLNETLTTMEWFENELEGLAQDVVNGN